MIRTLYIVRHARAEDGAAFVSDFERELVPSGIIDAARMGKFLNDNQLTTSVLVSSSAKRAYQTAQIIGEQLGIAPEAIRSQKQLYDGGPKAYLAEVVNLPDDCSSAMIVGHNPDVSYFAEYLTGADVGSMSKGAVVIMTFENVSWSEVSARMATFVAYHRPKAI